MTILLLLKRVDCNDGVSSYLESLITGLKTKGDRVVIVSGDVTTPYGSELRRDVIRDAALDWIVLNGFGALLPKPAHLRKILSLINIHQIDVVSPQGFSALPVAYIVGRMSGRPVVTNYHPSTHSETGLATIGKLSWKQKIFYKLVTFAFRSDRYIAMSSEIEELFYNQCGIPRRRIHKQMLGVETDFYRASSDEERKLARTRFGLDEGTLVAVLPGRMNFNKGHDVAAAAFRILRTQRSEISAVCLLPGAGDQRDVIEANVLRDDGDRACFRFLGFVDRETLRDTYWAADIVLLPSRMEGFGLVVAEAMCCGAIVIRTPSGGWQDQVVEGKTGYIVPFNDPVALASAIGRVSDSPVREDMRKQAMELASRRFAKSLMIEGTADLYRESATKRRLRVARQVGSALDRGFRQVEQ